MYIQNIYLTNSKKINVDGKPITYNEIKEYPDSFKKTQEFKNCLTMKFIKEVTKDEYDRSISNKQQQD
jgi:hypothetical protein